MTETDTVTRKFRAAKQDVTEYVDANWLASAGVSKVYQVFVYDPDRRVHCCSLTASWEMVPVYHTYDPARDLDDDEREAVFEELLSWGIGDVEYWDTDPAKACETLDIGEHTGDDDAECEAAAVEDESCNPSW